MSNRGPYVQITTAWQVEQAQKRAAYEERRRRWTTAWLQDRPPEPSTDTDGPTRRGRSRTIHDPRRFRLDF
jgi:hypothetical protein